MKVIGVLLLGLLAVVTGQMWGEFPFKHKDAQSGNDVREKVPLYPYGAFQYPFAPRYAYPGFYGYPYIPQYGYGRNLEFDYRKYGGFPVHVGKGQFYFLGNFNGKCDAGHEYGFYFADNKDSFVVCDHGRSHRFACPKGTQNRGHAHFTQGHAYGMSELCGVNNYDKTTH